MMIRTMKEGKCCWWPCFFRLVLVVIFVGQIAAKKLNHVGAIKPQSVNEDSRIFHFRHEWIIPLRPEGGVHDNKIDLQLAVRRKPEDVVQDYVKINRVPQYFNDLSDHVVENEVEYWLEHGRWSDRVILEKLYFGLVFGASGFPDHYYSPNGVRAAIDEDADDRGNTSPLEQAGGWDIFVRSDNYCEWPGLTCHNNKITEIRLDDFQLKGTLNDDIHYLTDLEYLDLMGEYILSFPFRVCFQMLIIHISLFCATFFQETTLGELFRRQ
jgi:hypothetical protein